MVTPTLPPPEFTEVFLEWFRATTETRWAEFQSRYFEGTDAARFGSMPWQQQARWLDGLPDTTIDRLERTWRIRFPPDYRLFLCRLHAPDRPPGDQWDESGQLPPVRRPFFQWFSFYNWLLDTEELRARFSRPLEGLLFDIEHANLWLPSWGEKPTTLEACAIRLTELVAQAPKLIPVLGHRYLLAEPCQAGNPVLSLHQSDIIVYGRDLRDHFFQEFQYFLDPERTIALEVSDDEMSQFRAIPFWGEFL